MNSGEINNVASPSNLVSMNGEGFDRLDFRRHAHMGVRTAAFSKLNVDCYTSKFNGIPRDQLTLAFAKSIQQDKKTAQTPQSKTPLGKSPNAIGSTLNVTKTASRKPSQKPS